MQAVKGNCKKCVYFCQLLVKVKVSSIYVEKCKRPSLLYTIFVSKGLSKSSVKKCPYITQPCHIKFFFSSERAYTLYTLFCSHSSDFFPSVKADHHLGFIITRFPLFFYSHLGALKKPLRVGEDFYTVVSKSREGSLCGVEAVTKIDYFNGPVQLIHK